MEKIIHDLGKSFDILNDARKFYPSALPSHSAIQATLKLVRENNILADSVLRVVGKIETSAATTFANYKPETALAARLSIPYCIAVAIIDKELRMGQFERERLQDQKIRALMKKIYLEGDPALGKLYPDMIPAKVEIITKDGKIFSAEEYYPKGFPKNPMSDEEISSKFQSLCTYVFEKEIIDQLREMIMKMESLKDILGMMKLLIRS